MDLSEAAGIVLEFFEKHPTRNTHILSNTTPDGVRDMVYRAHEKEAPDDIIYNYIVEALYLISIDGDEIESKTYYNDLMLWLSTVEVAPGYVNEAMASGCNVSFWDAVSLGNQYHKNYIYSVVYCYLEDHS